jgi:hypothetical protein
MQRRNFLRTAGLAALLPLGFFGRVASGETTDKTKLVTKLDKCNRMSLPDHMIQPEVVSVPKPKLDIKDLVRGAGPRSMQLDKIADTLTHAGNWQKEDIIFDIFTNILYDNDDPNYATNIQGQHIGYKHWLGKELGYIMPNHGYTPERVADSDFAVCPSYAVGSSIDWKKSYTRDCRWDIVARGVELMQDSYRQKIVTDCWHTMLAAAMDKNIVVLDTDADKGRLSRRLIALLKTIMRHNTHGSWPSGKARLTDLCLCTESLCEFMVEQKLAVDALEAYHILERDRFVTFFNVKLHPVDELMEGMEYHDFFIKTLQGTLPSSKVELIVGLDLHTRDSFIMAEHEEHTPTVWEQQQKSGRDGLNMYGEQSVGVMNSDRIMLGAI